MDRPRAGPQRPAPRRPPGLGPRLALTSPRRRPSSKPLTKQALRERIWKRLDRPGIARFPRPLHDRIPNFVGAEAAAARAVELPEWTRAHTLKCNPDAPQRPLRLRALREGKTVFMAVPRLRERRCFIRLDPKKLGARLVAASSIAGASRYGEAIGPSDLDPIDLVIAGSVAVNTHGARLGKGGGYSDLEFALTRTLGAVTANTPVLTTVHDLQVVDTQIPMTPHDVPVDLIVTPTKTICTRRRRAKLRGIRWNELTDEQIDAMPVLYDMRR